MYSEYNKGIGKDSYSGTEGIKGNDNTQKNQLKGYKASGDHLRINADTSNTRIQPKSPSLQYLTEFNWKPNQTDSLSLLGDTSRKRSNPNDSDSSQDSPSMSPVLRALGDSDIEKLHNTDKNLREMKKKLDIEQIHSSLNLFNKVYGHYKASHDKMLSYSNSLMEFIDQKDQKNGELAQLKKTEVKERTSLARASSTPHNADQAPSSLSNKIKEISKEIEKLEQQEKQQEQSFQSLENEIKEISSLISNMTKNIYRQINSNPRLFREISQETKNLLLSKDLRELINPKLLVQLISKRSKQERLGQGIQHPQEEESSTKSLSENPSQLDPDKTIEVPSITGEPFDSDFRISSNSHSDKILINQQDQHGSSYNSTHKDNQQESTTNNILLTNESTSVVSTHIIEDNSEFDSNLQSILDNNYLTFDKYSINSDYPVFDEYSVNSDYLIFDESSVNTEDYSDATKFLSGSSFAQVYDFQVLEGTSSQKTQADQLVDQEQESPDKSLSVNSPPNIEKIDGNKDAKVVKKGWTKRKQEGRENWSEDQKQFHKFMLAYSGSPEYRRENKIQQKKLKQAKREEWGKMSPQEKALYSSSDYTGGDEHERLQMINNLNNSEDPFIIMTPSNPRSGRPFYRNVYESKKKK